MMDNTLLLDNPLITKHLRSRLRRRDLLTPLVLLGLMGLMVYGARADSRIHVLIVLQAAVLFIGGTWQVDGAVAKARVSRILDFHRFSPLPPLSIVLGFLFGAPVREWLIAALLVPFELATLPSSNVSLSLLGVILFSMAVCAILYHLLALVVSLHTSGTRAVHGTTILVILLQTLYLAPPFNYLTLGPAYKLAFEHDLKGLVEPNEVLWALLHQGVLIAFLMLGAIRRVRRDDAPFASKPVGVLFFAIFCVLTALDLPRLEEFREVMTVGYLYPVCAVGLALLTTLTPSRREFAAGVRRATRLQLPSQPRWSDTAANWAPLICITLLTVAAAEAFQTLCLYNPSLVADIAGLAVQKINLNAKMNVHLGAALFIVAALLITFACTRQGITLRYDQKHANAYRLLFPIVYWVAPVLIGVVFGLSDSSYPLVLGLSPWVGIGIVASGNVTSTTLIGIHLALSVWAVWWSHTAEVAARRAAQASTR